MKLGQAIKEKNTRAQATTNRAYFREFRLFEQLRLLSKFNTRNKPEKCQLVTNCEINATDISKRANDINVKYNLWHAWIRAWNEKIKLNVWQINESWQQSILLSSRMHTYTDTRKYHLQWKIADGIDTVQWFRSTSQVAMMMTMMWANWCQLDASVIQFDR